MCMEDVRLGRETLGRSQTISVLTTKVVLVAENRDRYAVIISAPTTNPLFVSWENDLGVTTGIRLAAGTSPLILTIQQHGRLVQGPIYASAPAGAESIHVAESVLTRQ